MGKVLVLGGTGFIGRHVADAAISKGLSVVIGTRSPERAAAKVPRLAGCEFRAMRLETLLDAREWLPHLGDADVVINCVGILRQRWRETYERIHHLAPAALADACAQRGVRLVHVSALGISESARSRFVRSKLKGEAAVRASGADWSIVRPSLLFGEGGFGALWLRRVSRWPIHPVPATALGRIAVLDVRLLGEAIIELAQRSGAGGWREVELGGADHFTMREYLAALRAETSKPPAAVLPIPHLAARAASHVCDLLHATPFSFGHLELMTRDNLPRPNRLYELLPHLSCAATASTAPPAILAEEITLPRTA